MRHNLTSHRHRDLAWLKAYKFLAVTAITAMLVAILDAISVMPPWITPDHYIERRITNSLLVAILVPLTVVFGYSLYTFILFISTKLHLLKFDRGKIDFAFDFKKGLCLCRLRWS